MDESIITESASPGPNLTLRAEAAERHIRGEKIQDIAASLRVSRGAVQRWTDEYRRAGEMRLRQMPDNILERCLVSVEKLVPLATLVSVLLAVTLFIQGQRKEAADREHTAAMERESRVRDAYSSLDDRYLDYVKICLDHPDLDVFDTPMTNPPPTTPERARREAMVLADLSSILERAYLMYASPRDAFERNQWAAWASYIKAWAGRKNFQVEWEKSRTEFDVGFATYIDGLIRDAGK